MRKLMLLFLVTFAVMLHAQEQKCCKAETVVKIEDNNIFSQCFKDIDANGDRIVDCCEAMKASFLSLERGGRSNVITNYDFLKCFPNLTALGVGTTPLEEIDLRNQPKLEKLNVSNASELKKIILAEGCKPEISGNDDVQVEYAKGDCCKKCCKTQKK